MTFGMISDSGASDSANDKAEETAEEQAEEEEGEETEKALVSLMFIC